MILIDSIKINYIQSGYLPNWPYHLISDNELLDAFIVNEDNFFDDNYRIETKNGDLLAAFNLLKDEIMYHVTNCKANNNISLLPDWVKSYMLGVVISSASSLKDIDDLIDLSNLTGVVPAGAMNDKLYESNMKISKEWLSKLPTVKREHRPITMFGEPHVIKSLRLAKVDVLK